MCAGGGPGSEYSRGALGTDCTDCGPGQYQIASGKHNCSECSAGMHQGSSGGTGCVVCDVVCCMSMCDAWCAVLWCVLGGVCCDVRVALCGVLRSVGVSFLQTN